MPTAATLQQPAAFQSVGRLSEQESQQAKTRLLQAEHPPTPKQPAVGQTVDKAYRLYVTGGAIAGALWMTLIVIFLVVYILMD